MSHPMTLSQRVAIARGDEPADLVLKNARLRVRDRMNSLTAAAKALGSPLVDVDAGEIVPLFLPEEGTK